MGLSLVIYFGNFGEATLGGAGLVWSVFHSLVALLRSFSSLSFRHDIHLDPSTRRTRLIDSARRVTQASAVNRISHCARTLDSPFPNLQLNLDVDTGGSPQLFSVCSGPKQHQKGGVVLGAQRVPIQIIQACNITRVTVLQP